MPVRMGIGYGSFMRYGFSYEEDPQVKYSSAQFFGTGVVHAVDAEGSIKGIRIAVHPSAAEVLTPRFADRLLRLPADQVNPKSSHELNYVPEYPEDGGYPEWDRDMAAKISQLSALAPDDPNVQIHYTEAAAALERMVAAVGRISIEEQRERLRLMKSDEDD